MVVAVTEKSEQSIVTIADLVLPFTTFFQDKHGTEMDMKYSAFEIHKLLLN